MPPLLANSKGQTLRDHSLLVGSLARAMGVRCGVTDASPIRLSSGIQILDLLEVLGWGHDLGKATPHFQKALGSPSDEFPEACDGDRPFHHEISWAYLSDRFDVVSHNKWLLNAIYWHHSRPVAPNGDFLTSKDEILSKLSQKEKQALEAFAGGFDWKKGFRTDCPPCGDIEVPDLFAKDGGGNNDENAILHVLRSILVAADRLVSSLEQDEFLSFANGTNSIEKLVDHAAPPISLGGYAVPDAYDSVRFEASCEAAFLWNDAFAPEVGAPTERRPPKIRVIRGGVF